MKRIHCVTTAALAAIATSCSGSKAETPETNSSALNDSVPFIGAPQAWQGDLGFRGEGIKIAIIDTGIDYTHADFGGPGTEAAYAAARAASASPADPNLFGPNAPKIKGGIDLAGDDYDANIPGSVPQPDSNPLDCNGHGTRTAGDAAGFGVSADGTTYRGAYYDGLHAAESFRVGPGAAPKADVYAVKVSGCRISESATDLGLDAIEWAIHNGMDVVSMSLGAPFGDAQDAMAVAATNAARAGIIVVAASGNAGHAPYVTSAPGASAHAISVAAVDSRSAFPGALLVLDNGSIQAQNSNNAQLPGPMGIVVLRKPNGDISFGCDESEYVASGISGKLVVTLRQGSEGPPCGLRFAQSHGAAAIANISPSGYPSYGGPTPGVTIPVFDVLASEAPTLTAATAVTSATRNTIPNRAYRTAASFSSGGPRFGDSLLKPNVAAPGVFICSAAMGSGSRAGCSSGTSPATPLVAGVAALATQAHPGWHPRALSAAVVQTADPAQLIDFAPALSGAGLAQAAGATRTQAVVFAEGPGGEYAVSFGFDESVEDFRKRRELRVHNFGNGSIRFNVTSKQTAGVPHELRISRSSIVVAGHDRAELDVSLSVPISTVGPTHAGNDVTFPQAAGYLLFTPADPAMNGGVTLHVPYYFVPRARAGVSATLRGQLGTAHPNGQIELANRTGAVTGNADFYALGLVGEPSGLAYFDTRAVGIQSKPVSATDRLLVFAINTFRRFSSASGAEFHIEIDVNGDGKDDFELVGIDCADAMSEDGEPGERGGFRGRYCSVLHNLETGAWTLEPQPDAPTDGSIVKLPVLASHLGITPANPRLSFTETTFNRVGFNRYGNQRERLPGRGFFNAFTPSISNGLPTPVAPRQKATVPISIDVTEWTKTPALGLMVVVDDNASGERQATLISFKGR